MADLSIPILILLLGASQFANALRVTQRWPRTRWPIVGLNVILFAYCLALLFFELPVIQVAAPNVLVNAITLLGLAMLITGLAIDTRKLLRQPDANGISSPR